MERESPVSIDIPFHSLSISNKRIQKLCGFKEGEAAEPFPEVIEACLNRASQICNIKAGYILIDSFNTNHEKKTIIVKDILGRPLDFHVEKIVFQQLKKAEKLLVFVCTAGQAIGQLSSELMEKGDMLSGYVADLIGSEVVETAMELVHQDIEKQFEKQGLKITNRYSPGYCKWQVSEQQKLFKLLPYKFCNIQLLPSSLMQPSKSVSGFIGIGKKVKRIDHVCSVCDLQNCFYRDLKTIS